MASHPEVGASGAPGLGELIAWITRPGNGAVRTVAEGMPQRLLLEAAGRANVAAFMVEGDRVGTPADLHEALASAGSFPGYYGRNWDALLDCWSDFSWLPASGYLCMVRQADTLRNRLPEAMEILQQVAEDAAERLRDAGDARFFKLLLLR